jgi:hypothetical protein
MTHLSIPPASLERVRILSVDGGPSALIHVRLLPRIEAMFPGFLERVDLFSGNSDGAIINLYLAHALTRKCPPMEALSRCIDLENDVTRTFQMNLRAILRLASGWLSMFDGSELQAVFEKYYGADTTLGQLDKAVSIEAFNASKDRTVTFKAFTAENSSSMTLVSAALASASFMPMLPTFRDDSRDSPNWKDTLFDGAFATNTPIRSALSDGIKLLWEREPGGSRQAVGPEPFTTVDDNLHRVSLLSLGCHSERTWTTRIVRELFSIDWPPFGLKKNKQLNQYGALWMVFSNLNGLIATLQRQATDQSRFTTQLLGTERYFRFEPIMNDLGTVFDFMWNTERALEHSSAVANEVWERLLVEYRKPGGDGLLHWIENFWMKDPPLPHRLPLQEAKLAAAG